jgi:hypothetical protein
VDSKNPDSPLPNSPLPNWALCPCHCHLSPGCWCPRHCVHCCQLPVCVAHGRMRLKPELVWPLLTESNLLEVEGAP